MVHRRTPWNTRPKTSYMSGYHLSLTVAKVVFSVGESDGGGGHTRKEWLGAVKK
jgi:hypothetical protein